MAEWPEMSPYPMVVIVIIDQYTQFTTDSCITKKPIRRPIEKVRNRPIPAFEYLKPQLPFNFSSSRLS